MWPVIVLEKYCWRLTTLSKAITIATQIEAAGEQVKILSDQKFLLVQAIHGKSMAVVIFLIYKCILEKG